MNRSMRAACGALATAAALTILLLVVAVLDPRATTIHNEQDAHDNTSAASADGTESADPAPVAAWHQLDSQLAQLETRFETWLDDNARRHDDSVTSTRRDLAEIETRLRAELELKPGDERVQETIRTTLAKRDEGPRLDAIDTRLKTLAGSIQRGAQETASLREAIGRLQPVLEVTIDSEQPPRFTIRAQRVPLTDVLEQIEALSDWRFETTAAATSRVSIEPLESVTFEQALEVLLPAAGCAARLEGLRVRVMSLAEARRLRGSVASPPEVGGEIEAVPDRVPQRTSVGVREVILEVAILSIELNGEFPLGIGELVRPANPSSELGPFTGGILDQPASEFLKRLGQLVSLQVLTRPRLRIADGRVARLETGGHTAAVSGSVSKRAPLARLEVTPRIVAPGVIELDISLTHGTVDKGAAQPLPARLTGVPVTPGRTVLLGGVIFEDSAEAAMSNSTPSRRPGLLERLLGDQASASSVPPVGPTRRELIVLVTPRLVAP